MAELVLGVAGAVLLAPFGLSALGFAIGSALGGALFPGPGIKGPRLNDLKVQVSSYGTAIPILYGAARIAGNVIWSTDLKEKKKKKGGKGGPSVTTYSYSVSLAVALCAGPVAGVRKVWADGKLVYNVGDDADAATITASNKFATGFTFYPGNETQLPDPTMEAHKGVGNVPGYRGLAYVVLENFQLEKHGNRIPNFTFEVLSEATFAKLTTIVGFISVSGTNRAFRLTPEGVMELLLPGGDESQAQGVSADGSVIVGWLRTPEARAFRWTQAGGMVSLGTLAGHSESGAWGVSDDGSVVVGYSQPWPNPLRAFRWTQAGGMVSLGTLPGGDGGDGNGSIAYGISANGLVIVGRSATSSQGVDDRAFRWTQAGGMVSLGTLPGGQYSQAWDASADGSVIVGWAYVGNEAIAFRWTAGGMVSLGVLPGGTYSEAIAVSDDGSVVVGYGNTTGGVVRAFRWTQASGMVSLGVLPGGVGSYAQGVSADGSEVVGWGRDSSWNIRAFRWTQAGGMTLVGTLPSSGQSRAWDIADKQGGLLATPIPLSAIVSNLCARASLAAGDINAAALTDTVDGYVIANQMTVRNAIEPLQQAFYFDAVESGNVIKFVKRGGASVATINSDDLAAHVYGGTMPDDLPISRQQEVELPAAINVLYINKGADYQQGTQQSKRITTQSQQAVSVEAPIVMADNKAKQMADVLIYDAWTQRTRYNPSVSLKHALIEPTDVVAVQRGGATHLLRITKKDESRTGVIRLEAVAEQSAVYTQLAPAAPVPPGDGTVPLVGATQAHLLDIPLLRDLDNSANFYAAAAGLTSNWGGAVLYKSLDGGASYNEIGDFPTAAEIGSADDVLGDFFGGNIFDELNFVNVTLLVGGELSSTTELAVLNGANAALLGDEIIQYKNAVLTAPLKYRLSGLLRGRKGTERVMGAHAIGERFVLLEVGTMEFIPGEINLARKYKAVTVGQTLQEAAEQDFTYTGANLKPLAPVQLGGGRDSAGDITISWVRRTRIGGEWSDSVDVPLGEASESYEIEIWDSTFTTLRRTLTSATPTVAYTSAQQVTDTGSNQAIVYVRVFQLSATVGRGYVLQGSI